MGEIHLLNIKLRLLIMIIHKEIIDREMKHKLPFSVLFYELTFFCEVLYEVPLIPGPGDFVTKVKQINSQSDFIWMTSFDGPSYLTVRSSVYIILI